MNCACLTFEITSFHTVIENWHLVQWLCGLECVYKTQYTFRIGPLKKSRRNQTNKLTNRDELSVIEWKQSLLSLLPTRIQSIIIIITAATAVAIVAIATTTTPTITIKHSFTQNEQIWQSCSRCAVEFQLTQQCWLQYGILMVSFFQFPIPFLFYWRSSAFFFFSSLFSAVFIILSPCEAFRWYSI